MKQKERVYLDWAAATPLLPEAKAAMEPFLLGDFGNPSAIHAEGVAARTAVEQARSWIAGAVQVKPEYVTFTGGGTEGNNLVLFGAVEALRAAGREYSDMQIVTTKIEHPSITAAVTRLESLGVVVNYLAVKEDGKVDVQDIENCVTEKTVLCAVAYANSEIGTVQPLHAIAKALRAAEDRFESKIYFLVDAAQAPLWLSCQFATTCADFLVLDAAKCCGPKGVGVVVQSKRAELVAATYGGGQEHGLRPGTENVPGIVGAGVAFVEAQTNWKERATAVQHVRDQGMVIVESTVSGVVINGAQGEDRLANNIHISLPGVDTEYAAVVLDSNGFAVSTKSACAGAGGGESLVVKTTTGDPARALSTLRFTLGPNTTIEQIQELANVLKEHVENMRSY